MGCAFPAAPKPLQAHFKIEVLNSVHFASLVEFGCQVPMGKMIHNEQRKHLAATLWVRSMMFDES